MSDPICCEYGRLVGTLVWECIFFCSVCVHVVFVCSVWLVWCVSSIVVLSFQIPLDVSYGLWDILMCSGGLRVLTSDREADNWEFPGRRARSDGLGFRVCYGTKFSQKYIVFPDWIIPQTFWYST